MGSLPFGSSGRMPRKLIVCVWQELQATEKKAFALTLSDGESIKGSSISFLHEKRNSKQSRDVVSFVMLVALTGGTPKIHKNPYLK
jgi:hypothetical protein